MRMEGEERSRTLGPEWEYLFSYFIEYIKSIKRRTMFTNNMTQQIHMIPSVFPKVKFKGWKWEERELIKKKKWTVKQKMV